MAAATELYRAQKWAEAAKAFEEVVLEEPGNATAWGRLGVSRVSLRQFEAAAEALQKSLAITSHPVAMYNLACAYAGLGQKEKAFEWLAKSLDNRLPPSLDISRDPHLASLRDDPRFTGLVLSLDKKRKPCVYSPEARQFDFWVGEWNVFNPQGQQVGSSVIQQISEGCGVLENWTDAFGGGGKSINFYDPKTGKWHQYWIGGDGTPQRYAGTFRDGALRFEGEPSTENGARTLTRLTFFNLGADTVRQFSEQSKDDGQTWSVLYDFKYVRKKNKSPPPGGREGAELDP